MAEGYNAAKEAVIDASHVVAENVGYAAEKIKEGANSAIESISSATEDAK